MATSISELNDQHAIDGHLAFKEGPGGLTVAEISNEHATASVALFGAHVLAFRPRDSEPVLWLSGESRFDGMHPIRGGIPVCWPWFSSHPTDKSKPFHGFARINEWSVAETSQDADGRTRICLEFCDTAETRALWPHRFGLEMNVIVGPELRLELVSCNPGDEPWTISEALHSYFNVSRASDVEVLGLDGRKYLEGGPDLRIQNGPIRIDKEVDRVYLETADDCVIRDPGLDRQIHIAKDGSRTTVVWNPWIDKAERMEDFGDDEYLEMVCVETTNSKQDPVIVAAGGHHTLTAVISVEELGK